MPVEASITRLGIDVLEAAKQRIRHCYQSYDKVVVAFSGGKDSMCVLHLTRQVLDELGRQDEPVEMFFNDEEVIPDTVIEFVQSYHDRPGFNLRYLCYPLRSHCFILGQHREYIAWDEARPWMRQPPPYAIRRVHPEGLPLDQKNAEPYIAEALGWKGSIALLNGIRADESPMRRISLMSNRSPLPFVFRKYPNIHFIRPIYDWETSDLFKFFQQAGLPYAPIYNAQMWHGLELRVATVLHDRAYSNLAKLREMYPAFYERVLAIWPDVATHERYWKDVDRLSVIDRYPPGWQGIVQYIGEHIDEPANRAKALAAVKSARAGRERNMQRGRLIKSYGGFPIRYVFAQVVSGGYMKGIHDTLNASDADIAYENRVLATRKLPSPKEPTDG